jgi:hypothetical protein
MVVDAIDIELCIDGASTPESIASYGDVSTHVPSASGGLLIGLTLDGTCNAPQFEDEVVVGRGVPTTVVAVGSFERRDIAVFAIEDDFSSPPPGLVRSRGFHGDPEAGPLDLGVILEDGSTLRALQGMVYGSLATATEALAIDVDTGYVTLGSFPPGTHYGAFRAGTDHQIVDVVGPYFEPDGVFSVYPIGAVITGQPPAEVMVCNDTEANEERSADCTVHRATVVGDPLFEAE